MGKGNDQAAECGVEVRATRHTYCALLVSEVGGPPILDTATGEPVEFRCVRHDPFDERFSCCRLALEPSQTVTELNSGIKDEVKTCGECGRVWCLKGASWTTLVRTDGKP